MRKYIGIDISKASLDVFDGSKSYQFHNDEEGFRQILSLSKDKVHLCWIYEPTGVYSYALTLFCQNENIGVVVVGPKTARDFARSLKVRSKTDKIDAKILYRYQQAVEEEMINVPSVNQYAIVIQQRLNVYEQLQGSRQRMRNLIEASSKEDKYLIKMLKGEIKHLDIKMQKLFGSIKELLLSDTSQQERHERLCTIPGISDISALYLMSEFIKYPNANAKQMTALLGLDPVLKDSGIYSGKARISKQGGKRLRDTLFMPTLSSVVHNDRISLFYHHLVQKGKPKKLAVLAAMRKLVMIAFSIYNGTEVYKPLKQEKEIEFERENSKAEKRKAA